MPHRPHLPRPAALAALATTALLLTGCAEGSTGPGVAVAVGDETISAERVDAAAEAVCAFFEPQFEQGGQAVPLGDVRAGMVQLMTLEEVARQLAEEQGVEPGPLAEQERARIARDAQQIDEDLREAYVDALEAEPFVNAVVEAVGEAALAAEGDADPGPEAAFERGRQLLEEFDVDVEIDPRYGVDYEAGAVVPVVTDTSVAVTELAVAGAAEQPDPAYAASLPESQRCG